MSSKREKQINHRNRKIRARDKYGVVEGVKTQNKSEILTQRRVGDIIQEFDMLGILNVRVISKGRGGRMREIKLVIPENILKRAKEIVEDSLGYR